MLVFVSYSLRDFPLVKALILQLGVLGHNVQFEPKMPAGHIRWKQVYASIKECDVFVLAVTDHVLQSDSRQLELTYARRLGKPVLGVLMSDVQGALPTDLQPVLNYTSGDKQSQALLAQAFDALPGESSSEQTAAPPDWRIPLIKMQSQIKDPLLTSDEQMRIIWNLQEFLERRETYRGAKALLKHLTARKDTDPAVQREIQATSKQLQDSYNAQKRARMRNMALIGGVVVMFMMVGLLLVVRRSRIEAASQTSTADAQMVQITGSPSGAGNSFIGPSNNMQTADISTQGTSGTDEITQVPVLAPFGLTLIPPTTSSSSGAASTLENTPANSNNGFIGPSNAPIVTLTPTQGIGSQGVTQPPLLSPFGLTLMPPASLVPTLATPVN